MKRWKASPRDRVGAKRFTLRNGANYWPNPNTTPESQFTRDSGSCIDPKV